LREELDYLTNEQYRERRKWFMMDQKNSYKIIVTIRDTKTNEKRIFVGFAKKTRENREINREIQLAVEVAAGVSLKEVT
jgi:hypothetical protein